MKMLLGDLFSKACVHRKVYPSIQILRVPFLLHLNCEELNCQVKENSHCTTLLVHYVQTLHRYIYLHLCSEKSLKQIEVVRC